MALRSTLTKSGNNRVLYYARLCYSRSGCESTVREGDGWIGALLPSSSSATSSRSFRTYLRGLQFEPEASLTGRLLSAGAGRCVPPHPQQRMQQQQQRRSDADFITTTTTQQHQQKLQSVQQKQQQQQKRSYADDCSVKRPTRVLNIVSDSEYQKVLAAAQEAERLAVVDFTASWCRPCRQIAPVFEKLSSEYKDVDFIKLDIDEPELDVSVRNAQIRGVPTFQFYKGGVKVAEFSGADPSKLTDMVSLLHKKQ